VDFVNIYVRIDFKQLEIHKYKSKPEQKDRGEQEIVKCDSMIIHVLHVIDCLPFTLKKSKIPSLGQVNYVFVFIPCL